MKKYVITIALAASLAGTAQAGNDVMMQYFQWYTPNDGSLWTEVEQESASLAEAGITALWLPPAYKGASGVYDVGYGVYDMYDLGEFNQKGTVRTKYGTKDQYITAIDTAHAHGIQIYGDVVFNHRGGADATELVWAVRVDSNNRNNEYGSDVEIAAWTKFDFAGRQSYFDAEGTQNYSGFTWSWYHFDGVDWAQNLTESSIFKFRGVGKSWDWQVDANHSNYDYLMYADLDMDHPEVVQELKDWANWYVGFTGVDGFRLDAVKHIKFDFFNDWLDSVRTTTGKSLFTVGEYWSYNVQELHDFITATNSKMSLFDAPLHMNFYQASISGGNYDMGSIMNNTLMKDQPALAVTLVDNHDTQQCQALESAVQNWFKPLAYAFILLREEGYPNIFHADYYGATYTDASCTEDTLVIKSHKDNIDELLYARKNYAYGEQISYLDHQDVIGWTRLGDTTHPEAMAVIMTDNVSSSKWMNVARINKTFIDITGNHLVTVTTNGDGWGEFPVNGGSYSVWVEQIPAVNVTVTFSCENAYTYMGQSVYVVGSSSEIGNWDPANAILLSSENYPTWSADISLAPTTNTDWKCIKKSGSNIEWQNGSNNSFTSPTSGTTTTSGSF